MRDAASNFDTSKKSLCSEQDDNSVREPSKQHLDGKTEVALLFHRARNHSRSEEALRRKSRVTSAQGGYQRASYGASDEHSDGSREVEPQEDDRRSADTSRMLGDTELYWDLRSTQEVEVHSSWGSS